MRHYTCVFYVFFFKIPKKTRVLRFLSCCTRFLEHGAPLLHYKIYRTIVYRQKELSYNVSWWSRRTIKHQIKPHIYGLMSKECEISATWHWQGSLEWEIGLRVDVAGIASEADSIGHLGTCPPLLQTSEWVEFNVQPDTIQANSEAELLQMAGHGRHRE